MRAVFSILSLLVVVAIVGILAKKQLAGAPAPTAGTGLPAVEGVAAPVGTPQQQVQQYKQAVQGAMQQARPMPDDDK